jgi:hypothetical protein
VLRIRGCDATSCPAPWRHSPRCSPSAAACSGPPIGEPRGIGSSTPTTQHATSRRARFATGVSPTTTTKTTTPDTPARRATPDSPSTRSPGSRTASACVAGTRSSCVAASARAQRTSRSASARRGPHPARTSAESCWTRRTAPCSMTNAATATWRSPPSRPPSNRRTWASSSERGRAPRRRSPQWRSIGAPSPDSRCSCGDDPRARHRPTRTIGYGRRDTGRRDTGPDGADATADTDRHDPDARQRPTALARRGAIVSVVAVGLAFPLWGASAAAVALGRLALGQYALSRLALGRPTRHHGDG